MSLRIGTDCSGIEAPIEALRQMGIPFEHKWACEIDKFARQSITANYSPERMYTDITRRKHGLLPDIDLYVCGFPCQPFSSMGKKLGSEDNRSNVMFQCIKVIRKKQPKVFVLENVKNFKYIEDGEPFNYLVKCLKNIKTNGKTVYNVYTDILNTKHYGIPQNRERIFIVGIRKDVQIGEYHTPEKVKMKRLDEFILDKTIYKFKPSKSLNNNLRKIKTDINNQYVVTQFTYYFPIQNISPTLVTNCGSYYLTKYGRNLNTKECLMLQGFRKNFKQVVSNYQMFKQVGNSMSVNVLVALFKQIFKVTQL